MKLIKSKYKNVPSRTQDSAQEAEAEAGRLSLRLRSEGRKAGGELNSGSLVDGILPKSRLCGHAYGLLFCEE